MKRLPAVPAGPARVPSRPFLALLLLVSALFGCSDSGGPGELTGTVQTPGPVLGGAVLEVVGKGITGFSGAGATRVFHAPTETEGTYRVVLLSSSPSGPLQFRVAVQDVGAKKPSASLVNLTSGENLPLPATAEYGVKFTK
ncbi:MAG: hypothetical protein ACQET1_10430 [Gemmatimonadota bacterium]